MSGGESDPPTLGADLSHRLSELRDTLAELATHAQRLARALEASNRREADSSPPHRAERPLIKQPELQMPSVHVPQYAPQQAPTEYVPNSRSMIDRLRQKRVTLPAATGWGILAWLAIEIGQAFIAGRIKLW